MKGANRLFGAAALVSSLVTAILFFIVTATVSVVTRKKEFALLLASAISQTLVFLSLVFLTFQFHLWCRASCNAGTSWGRRRPYLFLLVLGILPWAIATAITAVAVGTLACDPSAHFLTGSRSTAALVIWIVAFFLEASFFFILSCSKAALCPGMQRGSLDNEKLASDTQNTSDDGTPSATPPQRVYGTVHDSTAQTPVDGNSSARSSFSTLRRPLSSKRNISTRSNSQPRQSDRSSSEVASSRPSQDEAFDTWDTSDLSLHMKETVLQSKSLTTRTALPTIPGSRSPSPAKALDGPFFDPSPEHSPPRSPLPPPSVSQPASPVSPSSPTFSSRFPPPINTGFTTPPSSPPQSQSRRFSRPASLLRQSSAEGHIHPLFRCSSPTPPPSASPTTIVTAAPEAGEVIDRRTLNRMRSSSRRSSSQPPSASPLSRSASFAFADEDDIPASPPLPSAEAATATQIKPFHQRKRSASFEGCIQRGEG